MDSLQRPVVKIRFSLPVKKNTKGRVGLTVGYLYDESYRWGEKITNSQFSQTWPKLITQHRRFKNPNPAPEHVSKLPLPA